MSQKINPVSNKLGILQIWNYNVHNYGKNLKNYTKFIQVQKLILNYVNCILNTNFLLIENIHIIRTIHQTTIRIAVFDLQKTFTQKTDLVKAIVYWLKTPIVLSFYRKINLGNSAFLINNYVIYLFTQKTSTPKKILQTVFKILKDQSFKTKVVYTASGIKKLKLKGFKIEISGCFESSRSQMAKKIKCNFGSVPLTKLNGFIDYSNIILWTKFGSCGFKIWLFYGLNN